MVDTALLRDVVERTYTAADHPALRAQLTRWTQTMPLAGCRLLDVTPVFANTVAKYLPLLAAGADLTVSLSPLLPHDPDVVDLLRRAGLCVTEAPGDYHVVMDCAGVQASSTARHGYVELTKSGQHVYTDCPAPVLLVDDSRIKLIETSLGTGDGLVRALAHFGHDLDGRSVVVFGGGKVGRGAALQATAHGAHVTIIDPDPAVRAPRGCALVRPNPEAVSALIDSAWCIVTATGQQAALAGLTDHLAASGAVLANLGAEDEFGPDMPAERVLNTKLPVNFALCEPTRLRYLDATFALVNACALALREGGFPPGLNRPPTALEDVILADSGAIGTELEQIEAGSAPID